MFGMLPSSESFDSHIFVIVVVIVIVVVDILVDQFCLRPHPVTATGESSHGTGYVQLGECFSYHL